MSEVITNAWKKLIRHGGLLKRSKKPLLKVIGKENTVSNNYYSGLRIDIGRVVYICKFQFFSWVYHRDTMVAQPVAQQ